MIVIYNYYLNCEHTPAWERQEARGKRQEARVNQVAMQQGNR
ncbi:hypothetical protein [Moorena sp. SIOASIH]|nr:hypothetical protein [Moorena sp. SIOASIH]